MGLDLLGLIAPVFFFVPDLCPEEIADDCARGERSCEPNAKAHHCDGAYQSARRDQPRMLSGSTESLKKVRKELQKLEKSTGLFVF